MSNSLTNYSVRYQDPRKGANVNPSITERYRNPVYYEISYNFSSLFKRPEHDSKERNNKRIANLYNRESEELKPDEYYSCMLQDESNFPKMRIYKESVPHHCEIVNVYKFLFKDAAQWLHQSNQTLHLAMEYYIQTAMRCPNLKKSEIGIIAVTWLLIASKFDEIDYNLVSSWYLRLMLSTSPYLCQYDSKFQEIDIIDWERSICKRLDWNFHQFTSYHFLQLFLEMGVTQNGDFIQDYCWTENSIADRGDISSDPRNLTKRKLVGANTQYSDYKSTTSNTDEDSQTRHESTNDSEGQSRKSSFEINETFRSQENSKSFEITNSPKGLRIMNNNDKKMLEAICEYLQSLSTLIGELQSFTASKVAAAWVLSARKIMNIRPLWNKNMENTSDSVSIDWKIKYSYLDLVKLVNLLLSNYNILTIDGQSFQTETVLGPQPKKFLFDSKRDLLSEEEIIASQKVNWSISPRKENRINDIPQLGVKSKSFKDKKTASTKRNSLKFSNKAIGSPNGILKNKNQIEADYHKFSWTVKFNEEPMKMDHSETAHKKVSFNNQISVKHGSK